MGYNTFGNILYSMDWACILCASVQVGMFFPLAEWTESGGEKTFVHTPAQFFQGFAAGWTSCCCNVVPTIVAGLIGYSILGLKRALFCNLYIRFRSCCWRNFRRNRNHWSGTRFYNSTISKHVGSLEARGEFFYFCKLLSCACILTFIAVKSIYSTRFKLVLNAIRDNEDKAEAMGIQRQ